jgi:DNA-binding MarR family transcriptional regulator
MSEQPSVAAGPAALAALAVDIADEGARPGRLDRVVALGRTANFVRRHLEVTVLRNFNLTWTGYDVLHLAVMHRPIDTGVVAAVAHVSTGTVTRSAAVLIKRGLLRRAVAPNDRRRSLLAPTSAGWALNQQVRAQLIAALNTVLDTGPGNPDGRDIAALRRLIS